jgi:tetratricopeptide (TPR) repeat protein
MTLGKKTYLVSNVLLVFAMLFIGVAGFKPVVLAIGFFALMYFVYTFSWAAGSLSVSFKNRAIVPSLLVLIMSVVFVISGSTLTGYVSSLLKTDSIEVRPNFSVTATLIGESWKNNPILGVGPNMFKELWDLHKPIEINATQFWATNFNFGSGFITTIAATTGVLGFLTLISFLVLFFWVGFKSVFSQNQDNSWRLVSLISFLVSLFLWVMALFYPPSLAVVVVMFLFTGLAMSTLVPQGVSDSMKLNVFSNPKANFASVFVIVVLLISSIAGGYVVVEKAVAASMFQKSYNSLGMGDTESAKSSITNAIQLSESDSYWRVFAEISLARAGVVLNSISSPENMSDSDRVLIQTEIASAVDGAREAISWNSKNYENWFTLGSIYEVLARSGIAGAIENAEGAFKEAETRAPLNPAIPLAFGRLAALNNDLDTAKENVSKAINLKQNYTDAYFTLAQIEVAANNVPGAIRSVEATTLIDPNNAALYFQLGLLKYGHSDYGGAANAFGRAIEIIPNYANAQYFLGLSYDRLGKKTEAIMIFEELYKTNPDSSEVALILSNLKDGRQPFSNAEPPIDPNPETRSELPLEE